MEETREGSGGKGKDGRENKGRLCDHSVWTDKELCFAEWTKV